MRDAVANLVLGALTGSKDEVTIPINLKIPRALYNTYVAGAKQYNLPVDRFLESCAYTGIMKMMMESLKFEMKDKDLSPIDIAQAGGLDVSAITNGLDKLQGLIKNLEKLQGDVDVYTRTTR